MKKSSKKSLEQRGVIIAGRAQSAPSSQAHQDKRHLKRSTTKQKLKQELQSETARKRGPFDCQTHFYCRAYFPVSIPPAHL